mmetsp:Transcript_4873/g.15169  ORF Transcript_4873/g.15169 Transcript_4873/m.15169 type:complete len:132 (-) Transcript_4873:877-1272(-)
MRYSQQASPQEVHELVVVYSCRPQDVETVSQEPNERQVLLQTPLRTRQENEQAVSQESTAARVGWQVLSALVALEHHRAPLVGQVPPRGVLVQVLEGQPLRHAARVGVGVELVVVHAHRPCAVEALPQGGR